MIVSPTAIPPVVLSPERTAPSRRLCHQPRHGAELLSLLPTHSSERDGHRRDLAGFTKALLGNMDTGFLLAYALGQFVFGDFGVRQCLCLVFPLLSWLRQYFSLRTSRTDTAPNGRCGRQPWQDLSTHALCAVLLAWQASRTACLGKLGEGSGGRKETGGGSRGGGGGGGSSTGEAAREKGCSHPRPMVHHRISSYCAVTFFKMHPMPSGRGWHVFDYGATPN